MSNQNKQKDTITKEQWLSQLKTLSYSNEMNLVASMYIETNYFHKYDLYINNLTNKIPKTYFSILKGMISRGYSSIDEVSLEQYILTQSVKAQEVWKSIGGIDTIWDVISVVNTNNIAQYYEETLKYTAMFNLMDNGMDLYKHRDELNGISYLELSNFVTGLYSNVFSSVELGKDEVVDIKHDIKGMIEKADKGALRGVPYRSKLLTGVTHGMRKGEMTILAAKSGQGKTFLATNLMLTSMMTHKNKLMVIANEEDIEKWQREIITFIANNIVKKRNNDSNLFSKQRFYEGSFTKEEKELLEECEKELNKLVGDGYITFVNLTTFSMNKAIELIKEYSSRYGVDYYILDTLKLDNDVSSGGYKVDQSWLQLQQSSVKLYNTIKKSNRNAHVLLTYQLNKADKRHLTMDSLGMSKNVVDVASTVILARNVNNDEKESDGKNALKLRTSKGQPSKFIEDKDYMLLFVDKNRAGISSGSEIVLEVDKQHNIVKDAGFTNVPYDY